MVEHPSQNISSRRDIFGAKPALETRGCSFQRNIVGIERNRSPASRAVMPSEFVITVSSSEKKPRGRRLSLSWHDLARRLTDHEPSTDKNGSNWTPFSFEGDQRKVRNCVAASVMALDYDHDVEIGAVLNKLETLGLAAIVATTHSHRPDDPRFRVVLPLDCPWCVSDYADIDEAARVWKAGVDLMTKTLGAPSDQNAKDAARVFFDPRYPPEGPSPIAHILDGVPVNIYWLFRPENPTAPRRAPCARSGEPVFASMDELRPAVMTIQNNERFNSRQEWVKVLGAIKRESFLHGAEDEGLALAQEWSATWDGARPPNALSDDVAAEKVWNSLKTDRQGGATGATILQYASRDGWQRPSAAIEMEDERQSSLPGEGIYVRVYNILKSSGIKFAHNVVRELKSVDGEPLTERIIGELRHRVILATSGFCPSDPVLFSVVNRLCEENSFDPIANQLRCLEWDQTPRLDTWLLDFAGAEDTPLHRAFGRKFLLGMVARGLRPGVKFDTALILEGPQGCGKSSLARVLAGADEFLSDNDPSHLAAREQGEAVRGRWIVELSELSGVKRADVENLKAFISRQIDRYRPAYARTTEEIPRRCVFIGTTNQTRSYLTDDTGNRRFWPVLIGKVNLKALAAVRDQLLAEAVQAFDSGELLTLSEGLWAVAKETAQQRSMHDPWDDILADVTGKVIERRSERVEFIQTSHLLTQELNIPRAQLSPQHSARLRTCMQRLGWSYAKIRIEGVDTRVYLRQVHRRRIILAAVDGWQTEKFAVDESSHERVEGRRLF